MLGPQPAGVLKVRNFFRHQVIVICDRAGLVQQAMAGRMEGLARRASAEVVCDVDPVQLV